ncbi:MAG TPA: SusC/RagA family TonB-linked outer membrane protein [Bacteroidales bacterium]|nr:SusC/RagA family TonB-linked outer membrane protein [Bacteroidales bacterium]
MKRNVIIKRVIGTYVLHNFLRSILTVGALMLGTIVLAQPNSESADSTKYVTGIVRDAQTKKPVSAVQIRTLNNKAAATTDENGLFKIKIVSPTDVLEVKAYDYNTREIPLKGRDSLKIDLYSNVFTSLYPEIEGLTGPVRSLFSTLAAKGISDFGKPTFVSVDEMLGSRAGGDVRAVNRSGVSGEGASLFIRGLNSINMNAQPLFVVDGVIWNNMYDFVSVNDGFFMNTLAGIDLNDIETVTVVKDGTSLYGSKASNGVVIIKTKRGKDVATKIEVNALGGMAPPPSSLPMMNGNQFRLYTTDLLATSEFSQDFIDGLYFLNDDPNSSSYKKYHNITDWGKEVYRQGTMQSYNISVNGGDKKALYNLSIGYTGNKGVVKTTNMQRLNTRFNADFFLADRLTMGLDLGFSNVDRVLLDDGVNYYTSPTFLAMIKAPFLNPHTYTISGTLSTDFEDSDVFGVGNPSAIISNSLNTNKNYRLNIGLSPEYKFSPSLSLSTRFDYSLDKAKETYYSPIIGTAPQFIPGLGYSQNVFRGQQMRNTRLFDDTRLQYKHLFNGHHRVDAILGWRYLNNYFENDYAEGHNSGSDQKRNLYSDEYFKKTHGLNNQINSISNYANVNYSYDNRYFLTATVSVDGSSRFGKETQGGFQLFGHSWGVFPSANAAWLVSSEKFMSNIKFISLLKLRASYGITGNDDIAPYAWSAYFIPVLYMDRAVGLVLGNIGNSEIQWETSAKMNAGIDVNFFDDRLAVTADVYNSTTRNLLSLRSLPDVAGTGYYWNNGGELSNQGYEVSANIKLLNLKSLKWEIGASAGHYDNKIESLPDGNYTTSFDGAEIFTSVGNPAGVFYGYKTNGIFTSQAEADAANLKLIDSKGNEHYFGAGDVHFVDRDQNGIINEKDKQIIGDPNPDIYGSFNTNIFVKNFKISAFFTYSYGNDVYNYLRSQLESGSRLINQTTAMLTRWNAEGQQTNQPKAVFLDPMGNSRFSNRWIEDGSYLRLKTLSVSYKIPLKSNWIDGLTVWASANNLWTLTDYLGRDPDVSAGNSVLFQGIDTGLIPAYKSYFIGIKMNL